MLVCYPKSQKQSQYKESSSLWQYRMIYVLKKKATDSQAPDLTSGLTSVALAYAALWGFLSSVFLKKGKLVFNGSDTERNRLLIFFASMAACELSVKKRQQKFKNRRISFSYFADYSSFSRFLTYFFPFSFFETSHFPNWIALHTFSQSVRSFSCLNIIATVSFCLSDLLLLIHHHHHYLQDVPGDLTETFHHSAAGCSHSEESCAVSVLHIGLDFTNMLHIGGV